MKNLWRSLLAVVASLMALLVAASTSFGWIAFNDAWNDQTKQAIIKEFVSQGKAKGFGGIAIAGILGNASVESSFDPGVGNYLGCVGLVQFCSTRATAFINAVPDYKTNYKKQIEYIYNEMGDGSFFQSYNSNIAWYAAEVPGSESCRVADFNAFKGIKDPKCAAIAFAATHERCGNRGSVQKNCDIQRRASFAEDAAKSGKIEGVSADSSDDKTEEKKQSTADSEDDGGLVPEDDLTGMPDKNDYKSQGDLQLPGKGGFGAPEDNGNSSDGGSPSTTAGLGAMEGYSVASLKENETLLQQVQTRSLIRGGIMLVGIIILIYGVVLGMALMFDKANTVFAFSMLSVVTFGRMNLVKDKFDTGKVRVTSKRVLFMILICFVVSGIVLSGAEFDWLLNALWGVSDFLEDKLDWLGS